MASVLFSRLLATSLFPDLTQAGMKYHDLRTAAWNLISPLPMFPILHCLLWTSHFAVWLLHLWGQVFFAHLLQKNWNKCEERSLRSPILSAGNTHQITAELSRQERRKINDCRASSWCIMSVCVFSKPTGCHSNSHINSCPCTPRQPWHNHICAFVCILACVQHMILWDKPSLSPNQQGSLFHILWVLNSAYTSSSVLGESLKVQHAIYLQVTGEAL